MADLLRGDYRRSEYGQVILPFTVLRRLDAVMVPDAGLPFGNTSGLDFAAVAADASAVAANLSDYISGFSPDVREVIGRFGLEEDRVEVVGGDGEALEGFLAHNPKVGPFAPPHVGFKLFAQIGNRDAHETVSFQWRRSCQSQRDGSVPG